MTNRPDRLNFLLLNLSIAGVCVFDDETLTLHQAGIKDRATLCIESGVRALPDTVRIRVCLVTGNDTALKSDPKRPGSRGLIVDCDVLPSCTIRALRDLAGVLLLNNSPHWCDILPPPVAQVHATNVHPDGLDAAPADGGDFQTVTAKRGKDNKPPPISVPVPVLSVTKGSGRGRGHGRCNGGTSGGRSSNASSNPSSSSSFSVLGTLVSAQPPASVPAPVPALQHFRGEAVRFDPTQGLLIFRPLAPSLSALHGHPSSSANDPIIVTAADTATSSGSTSVSVSAVDSSTSSSASSSSVERITGRFACDVTYGGVWEGEWRLRRTNAFEECGDLLDEVEASSNSHGHVHGQGMKGRRVLPGEDSKYAGTADGSSSRATTLSNGTVSGVKSKNIWDLKAAENKGGGSGGSGGGEELITVEGAGVRGGDLLLLEQGPLPVKGMTKLSVYLWLEDLSVLSVPVTVGADGNTLDLPVHSNSSTPLSAVPSSAPLQSPSPSHQITRETSKDRDGTYRQQKQSKALSEKEKKKGKQNKEKEETEKKKDKEEKKGKEKEEKKKITSQHAATVLASTILTPSALPVPAASITICNTDVHATNSVSDILKEASSEDDRKDSHEKEIIEPEVMVVMPNEQDKRSQKQLNPLELALAKRSKHLFPLFVSLPIQLSEESSLLDLQRSVYQALQGESVCAAIKSVMPCWTGALDLCYIILSLRSELFILSYEATSIYCLIFTLISLLYSTLL